MILLVSLYHVSAGSLYHVSAGSLYHVSAGSLYHVSAGYPLLTSFVNSLYCDTRA